MQQALQKIYDESMGNYRNTINIDFTPYLRSKNPKIKGLIKNFILQYLDTLDPVKKLVAGLNSNDKDIINSSKTNNISSWQLNPLMQVNFKKLSPENLELFLHKIENDDVFKDKNSETAAKIINKLALDTDNLEMFKRQMYPSLVNVPTEEIKPYLTSTGAQPTKGFKLYKILEFIYKNQPVKHVDIKKFAYEFTHGKGKFDKFEHRGYYSTNLSPGYDKYFKYFNKDEKNKTYSLSTLGIQKMKELKTQLSEKMPKVF